MRRWPLLLFVAATGCRACCDHVHPLIEQHVAEAAPQKAAPLILPCTAPVPPTEGPLDLPALWDLALRYNPSLREAAAEVEAARGRWIQAGKYPNPRFIYTEELIGSGLAQEGNYSFQVSQEIVTAGKLRLDRAAAARGVDVSRIALLGRKFDTLTRLRRAYYDYQALVALAQVNQEVIRSLEEGVENTRKLVEEARTTPRDNLLRLQVLLDQARISQARNQVNLEGAWKQLATEVGVANLPRPAMERILPTVVPSWDAEAILRRVQSSNTELVQAGLAAEQAKLEFERARAEAIPNITIGAGWGRAPIEETSGALINIEAPIPLWDRKQGRIHEARAKWEQAEAARRTAASRLSRDTAEAFARYEGARQQEERLRQVVLPRLEETLKLVREGFQVGRAGLTFLDVQDAVRSLNDEKLRLAEVRRELWRAVADLQGLMQLDLQEELAPCVTAGQRP
jgi:cobalt-zinc-cadmium efflux system outer membrane protein